MLKAFLMDSSIHLLAYSPDGGLGLLWRKSLGENCNFVDLDNTRLLGIDIIIKIMMMKLNC